MIDTESYRICFGWFCFPLLFSFLYGVQVFSDEIGNNTRDFLLSMPVSSKKVFWVSFISGFVLFLLMLVLNYITFLSFTFTSGQDSQQKQISEFIRGFLYLFVITSLIFTCSCLNFMIFKKNLLSGILMPFVVCTVGFISFPLYVVNILIFNEHLAAIGYLFLLICIFVFIIYMSWDKIVVKDQSAGRILGVFIAILLVISWLIHSAFGVFTHKKLENAIETARALVGFEIEKNIPKKVFDFKNINVIYLNLIDNIIQLKEKYKTEFKMFPYSGNCKKENITHKQIQSCADFFEKPELKNLFTQLEKVLETAHYPFIIDESQAISLSQEALHFVHGMIDLSEIAADRIFVLLNQKKIDEALVFAKKILKMSDVFKDTPSETFQLYTVQIDMNLIRAIWDLLDNSFEVSNREKLLSLISEIEKKETNFPLTFAIAGRLDFILNGIESNEFHYMFSDKSFWKYLFKPVRENNLAFSIQLHTKLLEISLKPLYLVSQEYEQIEKEIEKAYLNIRSTMVRLKHWDFFNLIPPHNIVFLQARYHTFLALTKIAVALKIYRIDNGNYPEKLSLLSPTIIHCVVPDPFTGKDFIYMPTDNGFELKSGLNSKYGTAIKITK
ncbi:MAG: hypothetical protein NC906_04185 [Candidatus Omnitrophica bacterium]|nr:hypothetical protein [Candidatus Omnitrophota bacterium]